jgi:hypothetical protein
MEIHIDPQKILADLGYTKVSDLKRVYGGWVMLLWRFKTEDGLCHTLRVYHNPQEFVEEMAKRAGWACTNILWRWSFLRLNLMAR